MAPGRPPKKRRKALPKQMGRKRQFLTDNFGSLPEDHKAVKNGHVYLLYTNCGSSKAETLNTFVRQYPSCDKSKFRSTLTSLLNQMAKFSDTTSESVLVRFRNKCSEPFLLHLLELEQQPGQSSDTASSHQDLVVVSTEGLQTPESLKQPTVTSGASTLPQTTTPSVLVPDLHSQQPSGKTQPPETTPSPGTSVSSANVSDKPSTWTPGIEGITPLPNTPATGSSDKKRGSSSRVRSSKRNITWTPIKTKMKSRLDYVTETKMEMKDKYERRIKHLKSLLKIQKVYKIKHLNQELNRKKILLAKKEAELAQLRSKYSGTFVAEKLNKLKKNAKNEKKKFRRTTKRLSNERTKVELESKATIDQLKGELKIKTDRILELENKNLCIQETLDELGKEKSISNFQKQGRQYPVSTRLFVYDAVVSNVPSKHIGNLLQQVSKRSGFVLDEAPHQGTVNSMVRELGAISDLMTAEAMMAESNLTLGFDATTQEGMHINSVHVTTKGKENEKGKCYVVDIDELPGGTAEDYQMHVNSAIDSMADVYCKFYSTANFESTRRKMINNITNTMTDRAAVNHATIKRLELDWDKSINELNCHLHPLDTIASSVRSALKSAEPRDTTKKLFSNDAISHAIILACNKFRFKDGKGDPKGFVSALESAGLPKGLLPRYRGNRLHIMFHIGGKLHQHEPFFRQLLEESRVTCGGLQTSLKHDYSSPVAKVELQILGLLGKHLSGPWMRKFYQSSLSEISHIDGIDIVRGVIDRVKITSQVPAATLTSTQDFFGEELPSDDKTLQSLRSQPVDLQLFEEMMKACLLKIVEVLERQYSRYFNMNVTETLRNETGSARLHNIDAETIMGMFSASKVHAPNATMCFLSCQIRACKNEVVPYLDSLSTENRDTIIKMATTIGRQQRIGRRKKTKQIREEIAKRMREKIQKKKTSDRKKIEKKIKACKVSDISKEFSDLEEEMLNDMVNILTGKIVGHEICHIWYDTESDEQTMYYGKVEELLQKGDYTVGYWLEGQDYEEEAEDFDVSKFALAADLICGDLTLS